MAYDIEQIKRQLAKSRQEKEKQVADEYLANIKSQLDKNRKDNEAAKKLEKENEIKEDIIQKQATSVINNDRGVSNKSNVMDSSQDSLFQKSQNNAIQQNQTSVNAPLANPEDVTESLIEKYQLFSSSRLPVSKTLSEYVGKLSKKKADETDTQSTVAEKAFGKIAELPSVSVTPITNQNRFLTSTPNEQVLAIQKSVEEKAKADKSKDERTWLEKALDKAYEVGQISPEAGYMSSRAGMGVTQWLANAEDAIRSLPSTVKAGVDSLSETGHPKLNTYSSSKQLEQPQSVMQKFASGDTRGAVGKLTDAVGESKREYYLSHKTASDIADSVRARIESDSADVNKDGVVGFLGDVAESIGYQAPTMWASSLVGVLGSGSAVGVPENLSKPMKYISNIVTPENASTLISMGLPSYAAAERDALKQGYTPEQAKAAGTKAFLIEGVGELLIGDTFNVVPMIGGKLGADFLDNIKSPAARIALKVITNALGEGGEEIVQGVLTELSDASLYERDVELNIKDLAYEGAVGAFVGGLFGAANIKSDYKVFKSDYDYVNSVAKSADSITTAREASAFKKAVDLQKTNLDNEIKNVTSTNTENKAAIERLEYVRDGLDNISKAIDNEKYKLIIDNNDSAQSKLSNVMFEAKINDMVKAGNTKSAMALIDSEIKINSDLYNNARNAKVDTDTKKKAIDILIGRNIKLYQTTEAIKNGTYDVDAESRRIDSESIQIQNEMSSGAEVNTANSSEYIAPNENMTPEQKDAYIKQVTENLKNRGIKNVIVEELPQNGYYNPADNTIHLSASLNEKSAINFVIGHELTHYGASGDAALVQDIINAVKDNPNIANKLSESNRENLKEQYVDFLESQGISRSEAETTVDDAYIDAEIAADIVGEILDEKLLNVFAKEKPSLLRKIIEGIKNIMRRLIVKGDISQAKEYGRVADTIRKAVSESEYSNIDITNKGDVSDNTNNDIRYSIKYTTDNVPFVTVDTDILQNVPRSEWVKTVKDNLRDKFPDGVTVGNNQININKQSRNELTSSKYSQHLSKREPQIYSDKFKATNNLNEILNASRDYVNESPLHTRKDNITDFARGNVLLRVGINDYVAEVIVGTTSGGNMLLYDLIDLTPTTINEKSRYNNTVQRQLAENSRKVISANDIISQNDIDVNTNISNNSEIDTNNENQYSIGDISKLARENEKLKSRNEWLKNQMKRTDTIRPDPADVKKISENVRSAYSSHMTTPEIGSRLAELYSYMANGEKVTGVAPGEGVKGGKAVDYNKAYDMAYNLASDIIDSSLNVDDSMYKEYKSLINDLKQTKISIPVSERADLGVVNGYNEFRKNNFGNFTLSDSGVPVDSLYLELSEMYPEFFSPDITSASDQIMRISEVLKSLKPVYENVFTGVEEEASQSLAQTLMESFYDVEQAKPTFADKQYQKRIKQGVEYENKLSEERSRRENEISKLKEQFKSKTEKGKAEQQKRTLRNQIKKQIEAISKTLKSPTDTKHIPQGLRVPMAELISSVDLKTDRIKEKTSEKIDALNKYLDNIATSGEAVDILDPDLVGYLDSVKEQSGKRLSELSVDELENLNRAVKSMYAYAMNQNKLLAGKQKTDAITVASEMIDQNSRKLDKAEKISAEKGEPVTIKEWKRFKGAKTLLAYDMLDSESFFRLGGDALYGLYRNIRSGQDKFTYNMRDASRYMENVLDNTDTRKWYTDTVKYKTEGGKTLELTPVEIMSLYRLSLQEQALTHITSEYGGITLPDVQEKGSNTKRIGKTRLTSGDISALVSKLSPKQIETADAIGKYLSDTCSEWGNEVSMQMYGYKKFTLENYFPIKTDSEFRSEELGREFRDPTLRNSGFTKSRVEHAVNPLMLENIFDVFDRHVSEMAAYNAYVTPLADFSRVYNMNVDGKSVKSALGAELGSQGITYIKNFLTDVNGKTINHQTPSTLLRNYKAASVAMNMSVVAKQPTAYIRAMAEVDPKYLIAAFGHKAKASEMIEKSPIAQIKEWGFSDINSGSSLREQYDASSVKFSKKIQDLTTALAGKADTVTWSRLWEAVKLEIADTNPGIDVKSDDFYSKVNERFRDIIARTQVVDTVFDSSAIMRKKDVWTKMTTTFMAEPMKTYNSIRTDLVLAMRGDSGAKKKAARTILACTLNSAVVAVISSLATMLRDDEDEISLGFDGFMEKLLSEVKGNMIGDAIGMIPYLRDVKSLIDGFSIERLDMQAIGDIVEGSQKIYKWITDTKSGKNPSVTMTKLVTDVLGAAGYVFGVPFKTMFRDTSSAVRNLFQATGNSVAEYEYTKLFYNIAADTKQDTEFSGTKKFYDILYKCIEKGDYHSYNTIRQDMIASGSFSAEQLQNAVNRRQKELYDEAYTAYMERDKEKLNEIVKMHEEEQFAELGVGNLKKQLHERLGDAIDELYSLYYTDREAYNKERDELKQVLDDIGYPKDWLNKEVTKRHTADWKKKYDRLYELSDSGAEAEYRKLYDELIGLGATEQNISAAMSSRDKKKKTG